MQSASTPTRCASFQVKAHPPSQGVQMTSKQRTRSAAIHDDLGYPVIDCDGNYLELASIMVDYADEVGGGRWADRFRAAYGGMGVAGDTSYFNEPFAWEDKRERGN